MASAVRPAPCWLACSPWLEGNGSLVLIQLYGIAVTLAWSAVATFVLLKAISVFIPLRVDKQSEMEGLDVTQHGEALQ